MKVTVKHKKGSFYADWYSTIRIFFFMLWRDEVEVTLFMNHNVLRKIQTLDWLKICGWKSWVKTSTNVEEIAAYRKWGKLGYQDFDMEFGVYKRIGNGMWFISDESRPQDISTNPYQYVIKYNIKRPKGCWIPVFPYAGGTDLPENDYSYTLILK